MDFAFHMCHVLSSVPFQKIFPLCTGVMWGCRATHVRKFQSASLSCIHTIMPNIGMNVCRPSRKPTQHFSGSKLDKLNFGGASNKPSLKHPGTTPLGRYHGMRGRGWRVPGSIVCHRTKSYHVYGIGFTEDIWPNQGQRERERCFGHIAPNKRKETEKP